MCEEKQACELRISHANDRLVHTYIRKSMMRVASCWLPTSKRHHGLDSAGVPMLYTVEQLTSQLEPVLPSLLLHV